MVRESISALALHVMYIHVPYLHENKEKYPVYSRCIKNSAGPAFVCLLSHKYGYRPLPASIDQSELDKMIAYLTSQNEDVSLIKNYYTVDENAVPAEYVLKPMSKEDKDWWNNSDIMQNQMRKASKACFGDDSKLDKYFLSVTETEIINGVFTNPKSNSQAFFIERDLKDALGDFHLHRKIVDMKDGNIDEYAQQKLTELREEKLRRAAPEDIVLKVGYDTAQSKEVADEIQAVCDHLCKDLIEKILKYYEENLHIVVDATFQEVLQHRELALDKSSLFIGREKERKHITDYLKSDNTKPLVIFGRSGCGKTALVAVSAKKTSVTVPNSVVVLRFLGTTGQSGSARSLLLSICTQILRLYGKQEMLSKIPGSYKDLIKYFRTCMEFATYSRPFVIYLDSLDQLSHEDFAHNLAWLSLNEELPPNVKLVVSSLPTGILDILKRSVPEENMVEVRQLDMKEGPEILDKMLSLEKRKVTEEQRNIILKAFTGCPLPLFLRLSADIALRWHSYDTVTDDDIATDMPGLITKLFERLESRYGELFVHRALSYITVAKYGLSLAELEDILSCDDELLDTIFKWWTPPFRRIPPLLWARVRNELGIYLAERGTDGISAYGWYHRQFWETARDRYLNKTFGENREPF
ncbi:MAG: AAA family ATPase, partial [Candidatus Thiodiazotropha sp.]